MSSGLLVVGHGSRDPGANAEFEALVGMYRAARPSFDVAYGYVELAEPTLTTALHDLARRSHDVTVLPLFLFAAGHVKNDIPLALSHARGEFPNTHFTAVPALGIHPKLVDLAFERMRSALETSVRPDKTALIVVGRGASDPDANGDFCKVVRLVAEGRGFGWVVPAFMGITRPSVEDTFELVARSRPERIVFAPYLLFGGRLIGKLRDQVASFRARYPWIHMQLAEHLGVDERLFDVMDERVAEARGRTRPLPCDVCQYRVPISGIAHSVGGLEALLWSVRHSFTHAQAMPHVHAHRPLTKHVLVCVNADCAERGSVAVLSSLRTLVKQVGRERDIRVTRTLCMGRCGEGPTVAVYPDGIWYRGVQESDTRELVQEHLLGDRLVGRLVDNIMQ